MELEKTLRIVNEESSKPPDEDNKEEPGEDIPSNATRGWQDGNSSQSWSPLELMSIPENLKFNGKNYYTWCPFARSILSTETRAFIHITDAPPELENPDYPRWHADDCAVRLWLISSMCPEIDDGYLFMNTAKEIWDDMHDTYFKSRRLIKMYELKLKISSIEQGNSDVRDYFSQLRSLQRQLDFYRGTRNGWSENETSIKRILEEDKALDFLIGLGPEYDQIKHEFLLGRELPPWTKVYQKVMGMDSLRSLITDSRNENSSHASEKDKSRRS